MAKKKRKTKRLVKRSVASRKRIVRHRPLHKRVLLHPLMILFLMCVGVVLIGSTMLHSNATSTVISATVEAPELTDPAVISKPSDSTVFSSTPITVSGSCPDNSYVILYRNGQFSGVDVCIANLFQIQTDLFNGNNQLMAQDYNTTDEAGPQGASIIVTYNAPTTSTTSSSSSTSTTSSNSSIPISSTSSQSVLPLLANSQFQYQATQVGQQFSWNISINGGVLPYTLTVQWGDGSQSVLTLKTDPTFVITHIYKNAGNYVINIKVRDFSSRITVLQLVAIIHSSLKGPAYITSTVPPASTTPSLLKPIRHYLWIAWPSYAVVVALVFSFWLGERQEIHILTHRRRPQHR